MVLEDEDAIEHRLPTEGLVMMLMCLAWSGVADLETTQRLAQIWTIPVYCSA